MTPITYARLGLCVAVLACLTNPALSQGGATDGKPQNPRELAKKGLVDEAIAAWRAQIKERPKDPHLRMALIDFLLDKDYVNDALDEAQGANRAIKRDYELLLRMARACQRKGEKLAVTPGAQSSSKSWFQDVARWSLEASKIAPKKREPHALRGMALFGLGRVDDAEKEAEQLLKIAPDHPGGWILRGECRFDRYQIAMRAKEKDVAKALLPQIQQDFQKAIALDGKRVIPWRRQGDLMAWEMDKVKAAGFWTEALARDPERGAPREWIRDNLEESARLAMYEKALARFDALGTKPPTARARLLWLLGVLEYRQKKYEACRKHMQACYDTRNDWLNALFYHGLASWALDDQDMALLAFGLFAQKDAVRLAHAVRDSGASADVNKGIVKYFADLAFKRGNAPMSRDLNHTIALLEDDAARWNNYAFLCRETAQYEESWRAYKKALGHAPQDPQLLNDAAVILQYHLLRDLDDAKGMYRDAMKYAKRELAKSGDDLNDDDRKRYQQAKTDAGNNLAALEKLIRERKNKKKAARKG